MTEETTGVRVSNLIPEIIEPSGATFAVVNPPVPVIEVSHDGGKTWVDVDASWDGTGSLDDHRAKVFKEIKQPGFGAAGKVNADG